MEIRVLFNFRQFLGRQDIDLDVTNDKNVIVIHGENGAGKTTILQAFIWSLYGEIDLEHKERLLNEYEFFSLAEGESKDVWVKLIFEDRKREYDVTRTVKIRKENNQQVIAKSELEVLIDGKPTKKPQDSINYVLHPKLRNYFFFDGERIDRLARPESAEEIKEGIKNIMGVEILNRAIKHIKDARRELKKELQELEEPNQTSPYDELVEKEDELDDVENKLKELKLVKGRKKEEKEILDKEILKIREVENLEKQKNQLEKGKEILEKQLQRLEERERNLLTTKGYIAISDKVIKDVEKYLEDKRKKGELPSGIREQFIKDLIEQGRCICGEKIEKGDKHYQNLMNLMEKSVNKKIEDRFIDLTAYLKPLLNYKEQFIEELKKIREEKEITEKKLSEVEDSIKEIKAKIRRDIPNSSQELAEKRDELEEELSNIDQEIGKLLEKQDVIKSEIEKIKRGIEHYQAKNEKQRIAQKRIDLCNAALSILESEYEKLTEKVKEKISNKVNETFGKIVKKDYYAYINDEFELKVEKNVGGQILPVAKSTGENQIASLSFISSLVNIAKEWEESNKKDTLTGAGIYPIVMDSPFGTLDPEYRNLVSKYIQKLAPQIVLLVSNSQWSKEVEDNLREHINHEYVLKYHNTNKEKIERSDKFINIEGKNYPLEEFSEYEYTEIIKVK